MYCTKCKFTTFDHSLSCPKCGLEWNALRERLNLAWITAPGYDWFGNGAAGAALAGTDEADLETIDPGVLFEDQLKAESPVLQELSFDEFEEVNLGVADNEPFSLKNAPPAGKDQDHSAGSMPEIELSGSEDADLDDTLLGREVDDIATIELDLDEQPVPAQPSNGRTTNTHFAAEELSLDDLDLELEDLVQEAARK
jgi:hypothetical protein